MPDNMTTQYEAYTRGGGTLPFSQWYVQVWMRDPATAPANQPNTGGGSTSWGSPQPQSLVDDSGGGGSGFIAGSGGVGGGSSGSVLPPGYNPPPVDYDDPNPPVTQPPSAPPEGLTMWKDADGNIWYIRSYDENGEPIWDVMRPPGSDSKDDNIGDSDPDLEERLKLEREKLKAEQDRWEAEQKQKEAEAKAEAEWRAKQEALERERLAWEREQAKLEAEAKRQEQLANLRANPASWLEYASLAGETPVVQPWMLPLMQNDYSYDQSGMSLNNTRGISLPGQIQSGTGEQGGFSFGDPELNNPVPMPQMGMPSGGVPKVGDALPGWTKDGKNLNGLKDLINPSTQYLARLNPSMRGQYYGYERANTGASIEDTQQRLWNMAPPNASKSAQWTR